MKILPSICVAFIFAGSAIADVPKWATDVSRAVSQASKEKKLGFILLGRESCGNCQATRKLINEGKIPVTADTFVIADINVDEPRAHAEFDKKFKKEKFGSTLPFVVITDAKGKALASYNGYKNAADLTLLIEDAKKKAEATAK